MKGSGERWSYSFKQGLLEVGYGSGAHYPLVAVFYESSGYCRMTSGPGGEFGPSFVLPGCVWFSRRHSFRPGNKRTEELFQGAPTNYSVSEFNQRLQVEFKAQIRRLKFRGAVILQPPHQGKLRAEVSVVTEGGIRLAERPAEAFKTVFLSSMHDSADIWDSSRVFVERTQIELPEEGWIVRPPKVARHFGLVGGTSAWRGASPSIKVTLREPAAITGWVTRSSDPNDDNVGFWAGSDSVGRSWSYTVEAF